MGLEHLARHRDGRPRSAAGPNRDARPQTATPTPARTELAVAGLARRRVNPVFVGAADAGAEHAAEQTAARVVQALRGRGVAAPDELRGQQVPTAARQHTPAGDGPTGTIGAAGGRLDTGSAERLQDLRGRGGPLPTPLRRDMESAMGADLSQVRVHTGDEARALSATMQASAFTLGNDVFFGNGMPDAATESGQRLIAHELAHTVQQSGSVRRDLTDLFKRSDESKQKSSDAAVKKKALLDARAAMKKEAAQARLEAARGNKLNKEHTERATSGYAAGNAATKLAKTKEHDQIEKAFATMLDREREARAAARQRVTGRVGTQDQEDEAQLAEEEAADLVWTHASPAIRAFRPLRFDDFDKALAEVRELRLQHAGDAQGEAASLMQANEAAFGTPLKPAKALKKVNKARSVDHKATRVAESTGQAPADLAKADTVAAEAAAAAKLTEAGEKRTVGAAEKGRVEGKSERKLREAKYLPDSKAEDAKTYIGGIGDGVTAVGAATKGGTKAVVGGGVGGASEDSGSEISELVGTSTGGLGQVLTLVSDILGFVATIQDIKRGTADRDAKLVATQKAVGVTASAAAITKSALVAAKEGVENFGGVGTVATEAGSAIPIVGLVLSVLGVIDGALDLIPVSTRLGTGLESLDAAMVAGKAPLAASITRLNRRNVQQIEKATFSIAKNSTMVGLHIAEIGSAGGFGIPLATKLAVGLTGVAHSLGHAIYDTVNESQSSVAKKDHEVKHEEGASRELLRLDLGTSVDVLIVAAQKHKLAYARTVLLDYGVTETEIGTMRMQELREKVLDGLDAEGDPKTVAEKIEDATDSVKKSLHIKKKPTGIKSAKAEKDTLDSVVSAASTIASPLVILKNKIVDKHRDAKYLIAEKNRIGYEGNDKRGRGAAVEHMIRSQKKIEKSFAKVRSDQAADGVPAEFLPRSAADSKKRTKVAKAKQVGQSDKAFFAQLAQASDTELDAMLDAIDMNDPEQVRTIRFIEYEVERRLAAKQNA